jgi:hypothetical protein
VDAARQSVRLGYKMMIRRDAIQMIANHVKPGARWHTALEKGIRVQGTNS